MILASIHFQQSFLENHMQETDKKLRLKESSFVTQVLLTTKIRNVKIAWW